MEREDGEMASHLTLSGADHGTEINALKKMYCYNNVKPIQLMTTYVSFIDIK